jgi:hypothetical protein
MSGGWNERFEVRRQWIRRSRTDDVRIFLGGFALSIVDICKSFERMGQSASA